jgi:long-chain acyl-CoA synthetase
MIFTSGTTGRPKAIEYTHAQLMIACQAIHDTIPRVRVGDPTLCWLPMAHLFQRMMNLVAIAQGATIYFVEDPRNVARCAAEVHPTALIGVPRFYEKLHAAIEQRILGMPAGGQRLVRAAFDAAKRVRQSAGQGRGIGRIARFKHRLLDRLVLARIRASLGTRIQFMVTGSAPISQPHLEFFADLGWMLLEAYGISENAIPMAANRPGNVRFGSVGIPLQQNEIRIAEDGEILVRGPGLFNGYWGEPRDDELFTHDGYFRTGDIGCLDDDGYLYLKGRKSEMLKTSTGRKIFPASVEAVYQEHPLIDRMVVFGQSRPYLVGLVEVNEQELRRELSLGNSTAGIAALVNDPRVLDSVGAAVEKQGEQLAPYQRVAQFTLIPRRLEVARGELTPNLKLRRDIVVTMFAHEIDHMYDESWARQRNHTSGLSAACLISS